MTPFTRDIEADEKLCEAAKTKEHVDGDNYGVPGSVGLVEKIDKELEQLRQELTRQLNRVAELEAR